MNYGNRFYNAIYIAVLVLVVLLVALYFMGFFEPIGLTYEPAPPPPPSVETSP